MLRILIVMLACLVCELYVHGQSQNNSSNLQDDKSAESTPVKYCNWERSQRQEFYPEGKKAVKGYKQFERANIVWEDHLDKEGNMVNYSAASMEAYIQLKSMTEPSGGTWDFVGPHGPDFDSDFSTGGVGRVNCVQVYDADTWFVGTSGGGLWKTDNSGIYLPGVWDNPWENLTSNFPLLGISGIAVNPSDQNEIYILTGDPYNVGLPSIGIYKTTDQGENWEATGLAFDRNQTEYGYKLLYNPQNFLEMYAATSAGLYHTLDGWATITEVIDELVFDVEYHPTDTSVVYASTDDHIFHKCCGNPDFTGANSGILYNNTRRIELEVTAGAPDWVYAVLINDDRSLKAIYHSTNEAASWTLHANSDYNLSASTDPEDPEDKGQGEYCMALYASDELPTQLYYGCVNLWSSASMGLAGTWGQLSDWSSDDDVHADWHALVHNPYNDVLIAGTDGGVYVSSDGGDTWSNRNFGLHITEFYYTGVDNNYVFTATVAGGAQDNGTISSIALDNTSEDTNIQGGDGFEVYLNSQSEFGTEAYTESQNGKLYFDGLLDGFPYNGTIYPDEIEDALENKTTRFNTPYKVNPYQWNNVIIGYDDLYYTNTNGSDWIKIWDNADMVDGNSCEITDIDFYSTSSAAFVVDVEDVGRQVWATTSILTAIVAPENAWTRLTAIELALGDNDNISDVSMYYNTEGVNYMRLAVSVSGYDSLNKILFIPDLVTNPDSVVNLTFDFPNVPVLCVEKRAEGIYAGTDIGVFFLPEGFETWQYHSNGLPVVPVTEIEFKETILEGEMMYISTYGRGIWRNYLAEALPRKWYVDIDATGTNDGSSWTNAFSSLSFALAISQPLDTLWIAEGNYLPGNARASSFYIDGEKLYGGFNGTETELDERNPALHISRISGDVGTTGVNTDNVYRLLLLNYDSHHCSFDGIAFSDGYANGASADLKNGACFTLVTMIDCDNCSPYVRKRPYFTNCVFENFYAEDRGGVFYYQDISTVHYESGGQVPDLPVHFSGCIFRNNSADSGGAIYSLNQAFFDNGTNENVGDANVIVNGCTFENNTAEFGGAIYLNSEAVAISKTLSNITFTGNIANTNGGALYLDSKRDGALTMTLDNCTFNTNTADSWGGAIYNNCSRGNSNNYLPGSANITYLNCAFTGNTADNGGAIGDNMGSGDFDYGYMQSTFSNCHFENGYAQNYGAALYSDATNGGTSGIYSFDDCTFVNNDVGIEGGALKMNGGGSGHVETYLNNCAFSLCNAGSDGGAIYGEGFSNGFCLIEMDSCSFDNNAADYGGAIMLRSSTSGTGNISGTFTNTSFSANHANGPTNGSRGGAVHHDGPGVQVCSYDNCTFTGNHSNQRAGAVSIEQNDISFDNCDFIGNYCSEAGGVSYIYHWTGSTEHTTAFSNCLFQDNLANGNGGVVTGALSSPNAMHLHVDSCQFINNQGQIGGCFYVSGEGVADVDLTNSTFTSNQTEASGEGGVLAYNTSGSVEVLDCTFEANTAGNTGGALDIISYANDVTINIQDSDFINGDADYGGAIHTWNDNGTTIPTVINNCTFDNNEADLGVGAIYLQVYDYCEIEIDSCTFTNNHSLSSASSTGAVYLKSFLASDTSYMHVSNTLFDNNSAIGAAGALHFVSDGSLHSLVENCTFTNNTSNLSGGAIRVYSFANDYADVDILNCLFDNNTAATRGGAIHLETSTGNAESYGMVNQSVMVNNQAADGGAIHCYINQSTATNYLDVRNCTVANNHATTKCGGMYAQRTNGTMSGSTVNNILWGNTDTDTEVDQKQAYLNGTGSITMGNTDVQDMVPSTFINSSDNISSNPQFINTADVNGADNTLRTIDDGFAIQENSPCIDIAEETFALAFDYAITPRPQLNGYDIGAYESLAAEPELCFGDLNDDGVVNTTDLLLFMSEFGCTTSCGIADLNGDGVVNTTDLLLFMSAFGNVCE